MKAFTNILSKKALFVREIGPAMIAKYADYDGAVEVFYENKNGLYLSPRDCA